MTKILAIADIHIHDYPQRNPSEKYRLLQDRKIAQNIIEVGRQEGASVLVIAGDVLEKYIIRPYIQAEVKGFLDELMKNFDYGFIIWGNHDQDNKSVNSEFKDSCLSVMLPPNLHYADKKDIVIDNTRIGFYNWRPEFDLSWINGKVDVLFTHATISYSDVDRIHSQVLDESKFDLAICGDIHRAAQKGKYVSIGIPQRCKMGDSEDCSGVILDCTNKQFKWVNLNPHDNLMKFTYTNQRDQEGWDGSTWKVYKPDSFVTTGNSGTQEIQIPAWTEINNLINNIISGYHLDHIHGQVLQTVKNMDSKEVDFNFVITRFHCKNWRSIEEVELFLGDGDKILITGENGAGKSSLLSAIRYAFLENRNIKEYIQFGANECMTEVEFLYQGNSYVIQRGCKVKGKSGAGYTKFWINGEEQKTNNKSDLDADLHVRFPFIDYMDIYFFDSNHPKLIGCITPERKSEIVSKFYKMDKIDTYNEGANIILESMQGGAQKWQEELEKNQGLLKYIEDKLKVIQLPERDLQTLIGMKQEGIRMQEAWSLYNQYMTRTANLQAQKSVSENRIESLKVQIESLRNPEVINKEIEEINQRVQYINSLLHSLSEIKAEGKRVYLERQGLDKTKFCSVCGQPISPGQHLEQHKAELDKRIQELLRKQAEIYAQFEAEKITKESANNMCGVELANLNKEIALRISEKNNTQRLKTEFKNEENTLINIKNQLGNLGTPPPQVTLPEGFMEEMGKIESEIGVWNQYNSLKNDGSKYYQIIQGCQVELQKIADSVKDLKQYIELTGPTGKIYEEIMTNLAQQFTDNQVKYDVIRTKRGKVIHLDLGSHYINEGGNEVSYENCSDGQKTILDINFLSKVVTRMGLLVMDEFLKHLDAKNHEVCIDILGTMNIGMIMLCSHMESVPAFNNKSITLKLSQSGSSIITCK